MSSTYPGRHAGGTNGPATDDLGRGLGAGTSAGMGAPLGATGATAVGSTQTATSERLESSDQSVGQLMSRVAQDLSTLVRQEIALAKAEMTQEATKSGKAAGMVSGAGLAGYFVLLFLSLALTGALAAVMPFGWAALIVAAVWAVIGAVLFAKGRSTFRQVHPKPERTIETIKETPQALDLRDRTATGGTHG